MTRKRFVKLLMADGYSRNDANIIATDARSRGIGYGAAYAAHPVIHDIGIKFDAAAIDALADAVRNIADAAAKVAQAIAKATTAFAETFRTEMEVTHE